MIAGSKILIVDDNPEIVDILADFLGLNDCEIYRATTGREALDLLEGQDVEIAILDVKLPDISGISLLDTIKVNKPTIAVIMVTGYYDPNFVIDAMRKGASDFLLKPFELDKLMLVMMRVVRERNLLIEKENILHNLEDKKKIELLNRELQKKIKELTTMYHISNKFNSLNIYDDVYEKVVGMVGELLDVKSCGYYISDSDNKELILYTGLTKHAPLEGRQKITVREDLFKEASTLRKHLLIEDKIYFPLVIKGECIGFIMAEFGMNGGKQKRSYEGETIFLRLIADKACTHIENRMLYESLFENILHTLKSLIVAINKRDLYTEGHCKRVTEMSLELGRRMGIDDYERDVIKVVGPVHDLGKIGIPDSILLKPEGLTDDEYSIMKGHSIYGEEIMSRFEILSTEAKIIRHHHERYDGRGYPDNLSGETIPLCSRIIAVCDAYDAMVTDRPYRRAATRAEIRDEIKRCRGSQFDPLVADNFVNMI
ncbi:MAG TPA: HD domain-containing phosphohydrolase [Syntrophorhabdaceae bacterium]|nr:HD domain-containing phosphohydrolase [Syntrophorhabdaceae bacterium]